MRDRESLFNDHIAEVKRREREEKSALKDKVSELLLFCSMLQVYEKMLSVLQGVHIAEDNWTKSRFEFALSLDLIAESIITNLTPYLISHCFILEAKVYGVV